MLHTSNMVVPLLLAPMAELSHRPLRELIESFGSAADEYFTEMISAGTLVNKGPFEEWYIDNGPCPEKLVYQLVCGDEQNLLKALVLLDRKECLGIDINMGCSAPLIRRTGAGVSWMADIDKAGSLIRRLRPHTCRRLSVKLRTGLNDDFEYLVKFCRRLEEEGVDFITLHPRTAREKFRRKARWDYVSALKKELRVPLAGNGDIASSEEIILRSGECDAVMIGRLAVRCPWVFAEVREDLTPRRKDAEENRRISNNSAFSVSLRDDRYLLEETGLKFLELLARYQPAEFHLSRARLFFSYFCDNLKWGNYLKNLLNRETSLGGIERVWIEVIKKCR